MSPPGRPARLLFAGGRIRPVAGPDSPQAVAVAGDTLLEVGSLADCRAALAAATRKWIWPGPPWCRGSSTRTAIR